MLSKIQVKRQVAYWLTSSREKLKTTRGLYRIRRYADCLFFGHLILELALKANVVQTTKQHPPKIHNLIRLADLAALPLTPRELNLLSKGLEKNNLVNSHPIVRPSFAAPRSRNPHRSAATAAVSLGRSDEI